jgi:two-component system, NarL family, nitrate/nitrite response regulator NarL
MVQVLLITNTCFYREGLAAALDRVPSLRVVGQSCSWREALPVLRDERPQVVLVEIEAKEARVAVRAVTSSAPAVKVIALSIDQAEPDVLSLAEAGIAGYITRETSLVGVVQVIEAAVRGELTCSPRIAGSLMRRVAALAGGQASHREIRLTPRELEVVGLIGSGLSNREIGAHLYIEHSTVKNHVHNILEKLHVSRRWEAVELVRCEDAVAGPPGPRSLP